MDEKAFQLELQRSLDAINMLPKCGTRDRLLQQAATVRRRYTTGKELLEQMRDSIDLVRINMKYLLFDLEATKRENDYLRKMLDEDS
jgi:hypothetical protein